MGSNDGHTREVRCHVRRVTWRCDGIVPGYVWLVKGQPIWYGRAEVADASITPERVSTSVEFSISATFYILFFIILFLYRTWAFHGSHDDFFISVQWPGSHRFYICSKFRFMWHVGVNLVFFLTQLKALLIVKQCGFGYKEKMHEERLNWNLLFDCHILKSCHLGTSFVFSLFSIRFRRDFWFKIQRVSVIQFFIKNNSYNHSFKRPNHM